MGMLGLPDFWPMLESAIPNQVTETEGPDRRTLLPFATGRRSRAPCLCCSGRKIAIQTYISDDEIYFPKYYKIEYPYTKNLRIMSLPRSVVQRCGVPSVEISSLRVGS